MVVHFFAGNSLPLPLPAAPDCCYESSLAVQGRELGFRGWRGRYWYLKGKESTQHHRIVMIAMPVECLFAIPMTSKLGRMSAVWEIGGWRAKP